MAINRQQQQGLGQALRDQKSVEWVAMMPGQSGDELEVQGFDRQAKKATLLGMLTNRAGLETEATEAVLDRDFP